MVSLNFDIKFLEHEKGELASEVKMLQTKNNFLEEETGRYKEEVNRETKINIELKNGLFELEKRNEVLCKNVAKREEKGKKGKRQKRWTKNISKN